MEDGCLPGGFGSGIVEFMADHGYTSKVKRLGIPDRFIDHGTQQELWSECGYDTAAMIKAVKEMVEVKSHSLAG